MSCVHWGLRDVYYIVCLFVSGLDDEEMRVGTTIVFTRYYQQLTVYSMYDMPWSLPPTTIELRNTTPPTYFYQPLQWRWRYPTHTLSAAADDDDELWLLCSTLVVGGHFTPLINPFLLYWLSSFLLPSSLFWEAYQFLNIGTILLFCRMKEGCGVCVCILNNLRVVVIAFSQCRGPLSPTSINYCQHPPSISPSTLTDFERVPLPIYTILLACCMH